MPSTGVALGYRDMSSMYEDVYRKSTGTASMRSSLAYFIPALGPGKQLRSARLRALVSMLVGLDGDPLAIKLAGKAAISMEPNTDCPRSEWASCSYWGTWDFTNEVGAIAAQGGGEFEVSFPPIPPATGGGANRSAHYALSFAVNYPWRNGGPDGALMLDIEEPCPRELKVRVTPTRVRPQLPANVTMPPDLDVVAPTATVDAQVQTCPPDAEAPSTIDITFDVEPPAVRTTEAVGHLHGARPAAAIGRLTGGQGSPTRCTVILDASGSGTCTLVYRPSEVSGAETIVARALAFNDARAKVTVGMPGLVDMSAIATNVFRLTGARAGLHTDNHWGTQNTVDSIQGVAWDFFEAFDATLGINDLSLPLGGLFDISGDWRPPHRTHRTGTSVDFDQQACRGPSSTTNPFAPCQTSFIPVPRYFLQVRCQLRGGHLLPIGVDPSYHCEFGS
jgi:hypothetical protein